MKHQPFFCHNPHEVFEKLSVAGAVSGTIVYKPVIGDEQDRAALFHGYGYRTLAAGTGGQYDTDFTSLF